MQGARVADLQQELTDRCYDTGGIDGVFGPATDRALRDVQRVECLGETGTLNEPTRASLAL